MEHLVEWSLLNGSSYRARIRIRLKNEGLQSFPQEKTGPDYESIWKDQKMTGVMIIGSSLQSFSRDLLKNYLAYFRNEGFQFSNIDIPDFKSFFLERISNCEIDYFLKESHSDGDERNVFRFDLINEVIKGVRHDTRGVMEVIYLVFPQPFHFGERKTTLLSNAELSQIIRERERNRCGEITYFNTSCGAHIKARYEIEAVNSPLLLNIPSRSMSQTFLNQENDAIRILLHSYRHGLDFNGFRESLKNNKGYSSGQMNDYIFPDEARYEYLILEPISIPLNIDIKLERREYNLWKLIQSDEAL